MSGAEYVSEKSAARFAAEAGAQEVSEDRAPEAGDEGRESLPASAVGEGAIGGLRRRMPSQAMPAFTIRWNKSSKEASKHFRCAASLASWRVKLRFLLEFWNKPRVHSRTVDPMIPVPCC